jgi:hypothetical protein
MSTLLERARRGEPLGLDIIDMHGHLGACGFGLPDNSAAGLVATMDRLGVSMLVVSHMQCLGRHVGWGNREVLAAMRAFPGRLQGYAALWPESEAAVRAEAEWALAEGFLGFKAHNSNGFAYTHPAYAPAYELAQRDRRPLLFHTWGQEAEFSQVAEIAGRYPEASVLVAHAGCVNAAGYVRLAQQQANVYLDLAYSAAPRGLVARLVREVGAGRVVWGSDGYFFSEAQQLGKVTGADLPEAVKEQLLSTNAKHILGRVAS